MFVGTLRNTMSVSCIQLTHNFSATTVKVSCWGLSPCNKRFQKEGVGSKFACDRSAPIYLPRILSAVSKPSASTTRSCHLLRNLLPNPISRQWILSASVLKGLDELNRRGCASLALIAKSASERSRLLLCRGWIFTLQADNQGRRDMWRSHVPGEIGSTHSRIS